MKRLLFIVSFTLLLCALAYGQCPTISVAGPEGVTNPGDPMTFKVDIARSDVKFSWTVSAGTITEGQGTAAIVIATDKSMAGSSVTATVDIQGLRADCAKSASESAPVAGLLPSCVMDEWYDLKPNDIRGRLDSFLAELSNNEFNLGVVVIEVTEKERFDSGNKRLQFVVKHVKFRKFDLNRIWFVIERVGYSSTKVYRVPPGADLIPCSATCITIKGGDL